MLEERHREQEERAAAELRQLAQDKADVLRLAREAAGAAQSYQGQAWELHRRLLVAENQLAHMRMQPQLSMPVQSSAAAAADPNSAAAFTAHAAAERALLGDPPGLSPPPGLGQASSPPSPPSQAQQEQQQQQQQAALGSRKAVTPTGGGGSSGSSIKVPVAKAPLPTKPRGLRVVDMDAEEEEEEEAAA